MVPQVILTPATPTSATAGHASPSKSSPSGFQTLNNGAQIGPDGKQIPGSASGSTEGTGAAATSLVGSGAMINNMRDSSIEKEQNRQIAMLVKELDASKARCEKV